MTADSVAGTTPQCSYIGGHAAGFDPECAWCYRATLVQRAKGALSGVTEGEWSVQYEWCDCGGGMPCSHGRYPYAIHGPADESTLNSNNCSDDYKREYGHQITEIVGLSDADAEFIAQSRWLVPELVSALERANLVTAELRRRDESASRVIAVLTSEAFDRRFRADEVADALLGAEEVLEVLHERGTRGVEASCSAGRIADVGRPGWRWGWLPVSWPGRW